MERREEKSRAGYNTPFFIFNCSFYGGAHARSIHRDHTAVMEKGSPPPFMTDHGPQWLSISHFFNFTVNIDMVENLNGNNFRELINF
jgi:hypothetical protein